MEAEDIMELRDLPVDTRNYTIIDNITGKPIEQSNYSLTIDPEVIGKLNELKKINEEILSEYIAPVQKHLEGLDEILESKNKQITIKGLSIFKRIKRKIKYLKNKMIKST